MLEGSGRKSRWISGVPPLSFKALAAGELENYRIYGNTVGGESVGDLVESGEHAGEYVVPVTVEGKNLLPNTMISRTLNGITVTVNEDGSITCDGTATTTTEIRLNLDFLLSAGNYRLTGCPSGGGVASYYLRAWYFSESVVWLNDTGEGFNFALTDTATMLCSIVIKNAQVVEHLTFYPMIRKADIEDDTYEPYHAPVTVHIYLPEPIKMVGDEAEYIDYAEQKMHRIGADDLNVTLPAISTLTGTNVLSVGTAVQPSKIEVKGKIKAL